MRWVRGAIGLAAAAGLAPGCTGSHDKPEVCNGVDDNDDGRVDEGCPCTPFEVEVPFRVNAAVSLGDGWALVGNELALKQPADAHASYVRISDAGAVTAMAPLDGVAWGERHQLAWTGSEIAYVWGDTTSAHVAFLAPDGTRTHAGPNISIPAASVPFPAPTHGMIRRTAAGYDVLVTAPAGSGAPLAYFASTDATGAPKGSTLPAPSGAGSRAFALGSLGGATVVGWTEIQGGGAKFDSAYAGPPFSKDHVIDTNRQLGFFPLDAGDGDGDGTIMVFVLPDVVVRFDGTTATSKSLVNPQEIAWTGDHFEVAAVLGDVNGTTAGEVGLARDLTVLPQKTIFPPSVQGDSIGNDATAAHATVAADARRALFGFFYAVNGVGHQALSQVCL